MLERKGDFQPSAPQCHLCPQERKEALFTWLVSALGICGLCPAGAGLLCANGPHLPGTFSCPLGPQGFQASPPCHQAGQVCSREPCTLELWRGAGNRSEKQTHTRGNLMVPTGGLQRYTLFEMRCVVQDHHPHTPGWHRAEQHHIATGTDAGCQQGTLALPCSPWGGRKGSLCHGHPTWGPQSSEAAPSGVLKVDPWPPDFSHFLFPFSIMSLVEKSENKP